MTEATGKDCESQIVLCGSMSSMAVMSRVADHLRGWSIQTVLPDPDEDYTAATLEAAAAVKRRASRAHLERIQDERTAAVLVVNTDKNGQTDYIGPNVFAEIAVAFASRRPVYLFQGVPDAYEEELRAWEVSPLHGDLLPLVKRLTDGGSAAVERPTKAANAYA